MGDIVKLTARLSAKDVKELIRELAKNGEISLSSHARDRMKERGITMMQVLNCLSKGEFLEVAYSHDYGGGYIASLRRMVAGERIKVVVSLKLNKKLLVITAISLKY